jgi:hypothetical protein
MTFFDPSFLRALGLIQCSILIKKNTIGTEIYLTEHLVPVDYGSCDGTNKLELAVNWCNEQLKNWKGCTGRTKWNSWKFHYNNEADKFITYYNLACPHFIQQ